MSILFFSLRGVPDDEADEVRQLLNDNGIDFYETSAGPWGISTSAIWLYRHDDVETIRPLFKAYQQQRTLTQRAQYQQLKQQGQAPGFIRHNLYRPLRFILYSGGIGLILYLSVQWLFELGL